jgi:hypothetical protein
MEKVMRKLAPREWKLQKAIEQAKRPEIMLFRGSRPQSVALDKRSAAVKKRVKISLPRVNLEPSV